MPPLLAFLTDAKEAMTELVTGVLMVAGGFLVGYFLGAVVAWAVGRYVFKQQNTEMFKRVGRPVGGVILALVVALIVFTGRGKPHGEGGDGKGTPDGDPNGQPPAKKPDPKDPQLPPIKLPDPKHPEATVLVTIYGGEKVRDRQFYRFENEAQLRTLASLQQAITARRGPEKGKLTIQVRMPEDRNDRPADPRIITQVTEWAHSQDLDVTFPAARRE
jgi:hypothetical protein